MMQEALAARVVLTPRPERQTELPLQVAMLGHCPGKARAQRLLALADALKEIREAGFAEQLHTIMADPDNASLHHLPIPLRSASEFHDIFPQAATENALYHSVLAGRRSWLAPCVDDFFANGGSKLWIIAIPEEEFQAGFFPSAQTNLTDVSTLKGLASLLVIPEIGEICLPDLERIQIPARLPDVPRVRLDNPQPAFLPCSQSLDDDHRERRNDDEMALDDLPDPLNFRQVLQNILPWLSRYRPDIQCLMTLPLAYLEQSDTPGADTEALAILNQLRTSDTPSVLRQIQFVYPYLRGQGRPLLSPTGIVSGSQSATALQKGPWRSVAGTPLSSANFPYPRLNRAQLLTLRDAPGISLLERRNQRVELDDERLCVPALPADDYLNSTDLSRFDGFRSAELMRLLGYLRRQLTRFGEQLVFSADASDPRPRLLIERFLRTLWQRGALRGKRAEDAFTLRQIPSDESTLLLEIEIAPALPIDRIRLTFTNTGSDWQTEIGHV